MFDSIKNDVSSLILKCNFCCNRIKTKKPGLQSDLLLGQRDVEIAMMNSDYVMAKSRIDSIIARKDRLRAYDLLHAHLRSLSEQLKTAKKKKDVSVGVYEAVCTVLYSVPLVSNDLIEMEDIGSLLRDICGKEIDQQVEEKKYTRKLVKGEYGKLHLVDQNMVHVLNQRVIQPTERYQAIRGLCQAKGIGFNEERLKKHVGLFDSSPAQQQQQTPQGGARPPHHHHGTPGSGGYSGGGGTDVSYATPSGATMDVDADEFLYGKKSSSSSSKNNNKKKKNSSNKKNKSLGDGDEVWETVFDRRVSSHKGSLSIGEGTPPVISRHGEWQVLNAPSSDGSSRGSGLPPPMSAPGWDAPSPPMDGQMSFGRRFDNAIEFNRRTSTGTMSTTTTSDHQVVDREQCMNPLESACHVVHNN
ncbi:hypothetical protein M9434_006157 [Picochlorum sp. BPE23]|nr:hypothetical protein M9434_006157 [Picochlorum sp. BPE23]